MSNQGAFEPTKMCSVGRMLGSSTSVPSATWTKAPSRTTEYRSEPQIPQQGLVVLVVAPDEQRLGAADYLDLVTLDPGERLERRAGSCAAVRAVAVGRVQEGVR